MDLMDLSGFQGLFSETFLGFSWIFRFVYKGLPQPEPWKKCKEPSKRAWLVRPNVQKQFNQTSMLIKDSIAMGKKKKTPLKEWHQHKNQSCLTSRNTEEFHRIS